MDLSTPFGTDNPFVRFFNVGWSVLAFIRDFPYGLMPTNGVGDFRDFLPAPRICKTFFQSALGFCPAWEVF